MFGGCGFGRVFYEDEVVLVGYGMGGVGLGDVQFGCIDRVGWCWVVGLVFYCLCEYVFFLGED